MMEEEAEEKLTVSTASSPEKEKGKVTLEKPRAIVREMTNDVLVKSWRTVVTQFCKSTTMHGVSRLNNSTRFIFRVIWFLTVLTFLCILLWQAYLLVDEYRRHPSTTGIHMVTNNKLTFPAVTICNMNKLKRSKLRGTRFEGILELDERLAIVNLGFDGSVLTGGTEEGQTTTSTQNPTTTPTTRPETEQQPTPTPYVSTTPNSIPTTVNNSEPLHEGETMQTVMMDTTIATTLGTDTGRVEEMGTRRRKRGVRGGSNRRPPAPRSIRGNVYPALAIPLVGVPVEDEGQSWEHLENQFEAGDIGDVLGSVNPSRGELLRLGHQAEEFILQCSFNQQECDHRDFSITHNSQYGNCFTFNRPGENGSLWQTGKTGAQYGLHLTLFTDQSEYIGLLSHQSGVRVAIHQPNVRPFPEDEGLTASTGTLTSIGLRQRNITRLGGMYGDCRRSTAFSPVSEFVEGYDYSMSACLNECYQTKLRYECGCVSDVMGNTTQCSTSIAYQRSCLRKVDQMAMENELGCDCMTPCSEIDYEKFASFSKWPTDSADKHLKKKLQKKNRKAGNMTMDAAFRRKNMARLEIFYEKLNYESYTQVPKYNFEGLLGGIGGLMGFFAGMSLITVFELTGFIIQLLGLLVGRLTTPEEPIEGSPPEHESRIGRVGRRLTLAFAGHHGRGGSGRSRGGSSRHDQPRQTDL